MLCVVGDLRQRVSAPLHALGEVFASRQLRRLQLAWVGSVLGNWSYTVALGVYAYRQGGPAAVGLVGILRTLPAALASPFLSTMADRFRRERVMIVSDLLRAVLVLAAGLVIAVDGPAPAVYALVSLSTLCGTVFRPAQAALLPSLVRRPEQLTAANVASSTVESVGSVLGPALGGVLLAVTTVEVVFFVNALSFVWSAALVAGIRTTPAPRQPVEHRRPSLVREATAGMSTISRNPELRLIAALYTAQTLTAGAVGVLVVATALDLLELGDSGVGWLGAAAGAGGFVGGAVALVLTARNRLAADFAVGLVLNAAPLSLVAAWPTVPMALVALVVVGIGNSVTDVSAITLLQRAVPDDVLARVMGSIESLLLGSLALGAVLGPVLIEIAGVRWALFAMGAFLPIVVALSWQRMRRIDAPAPEAATVRLLAGIPIFAALPPPTIERLASQLVEATLPAGTLVVRKGDPGDRFYVIAEGEVEIEGKRHGPGGFFGEIALLRDVPRTADVRAATDVRLLTLDRDEFLAAVTGHEPSAAAADAVVTARLGSLRPEVASA
jgi:MFS family permease